MYTIIFQCITSHLNDMNIYIYIYMINIYFNIAYANIFRRILLSDLEFFAI